MGYKKQKNIIVRYTHTSSWYVVSAVFVLGVFYLYTTNHVAVQGYTIGRAEREVAQLRQENNQLRITEAELKSLYRIEEAGKRLNMFEPVQVSYIDASNPLALR